MKCCTGSGMAFVPSEYGRQRCLLGPLARSSGSFWRQQCLPAVVLAANRQSSQRQGLSKTSRPSCIPCLLFTSTSKGLYLTESARRRVWSLESVEDRTDFLKCRAEFLWARLLCPFRSMMDGCGKLDQLVRFRGDEFLATNKTDPGCHQRRTSNAQRAGSHHRIELIR